MTQLWEVPIYVTVEAETSEQAIAMVAELVEQTCGFDLSPEAEGVLYTSEIGLDVKTVEVRS